MSENTDLTYYQKHRDGMLNKAKDYYKNNKERLREQARDKYRNVSEEEKNKKREYRKDRFRNMSEEKKQRLKEYQKKLSRGKKKSQYSSELNSFLILIVIIIIIQDKIVFQFRFNSVCYVFSDTLLNHYIYVILDRLTEMKAQ